MAKSQRDKGARWEREVVRQVSEAMPGADVHRGDQRGGSKVEADVECPLFWVETKVGKLPNPRAALAQAERDHARAQVVRPELAGKIPIAVVKDDRKPPFVIMRMDDWLELVVALHIDNRS